MNNSAGKKHIVKNARTSRATGRFTIIDVARKAGVSPMTVSRSLKTPAAVQSETRARITTAIRQLGYVPNQAASILASSQSRVIGVLVPSLTNTVFVDTLSGIRRYLEQAGYQFLIGETGYDKKQEKQLISTYMAHAPDGFLLSSVYQHHVLQEMATGIPAVRMFDLGVRNNDMVVGFSQIKAGYAVAQHLIERGYRHPGFLAAQLDPRVMERRKGFRKGLAEAGITPNIEAVLPEPTTIAMGAKLLQTMLELEPDCDAIFCCNDDLALGALFECQRLGIRIPEQLAIVGFNDLPWASCASPSLTTVVTPRYEIGYRAAELLIQRLKNEPIKTSRIDLDFQLAQREST